MGKSYVTKKLSTNSCLRPRSLPRSNYLRLQGSSASQDNDMRSQNGGESESQEIKNVHLLKMLVSNWKGLTPKRQVRRSLKIYEEQQLKEIPGAAKKTGTVMHAALTSEIDSDDYKIDGKQPNTETRVRNHALIHYIAKLAVSNHNNDTFDFSFVQSLLKNGADINAMDKYGQTVFHEVARSWHPDVAAFLLSNGANINQRDKYGRAPLHVSAAVDYVEMVEFLVSSGAEVNIQTTDELQTPIHFAAKNDACKCLKALISYGVDVNSRDYQGRTPLQLAAAMTRTKAARLLIEMGVPAGVYDKDGEMALSLLVIKMPDVAMLALNQFHSEDRITHKKYFFLNYLEGRRVSDGKSAARTPLEAAIVSDKVKIVTHPVMQRLIAIKWERFGKRWAWFDFTVNIISAVIWTIMGVSLPLESSKLYNPPHMTYWRMILAFMALLHTFYEIIRQITTNVRTKRHLNEWKNYRETSLSRDKPFCHPQWPDEKRYVDSEIKQVREFRWLALHDRWIYNDWIALILIIAAVISHIELFFHGSSVSYIVHVRLMCLLLIVIWVRILKFVRPFQGTGALVASFTKILGNILLAGFLITIVFLPYASCFWMVFGGVSPRPAQGYTSIPAMLYEVFRMTVLDANREVSAFIQIDPFMVRILSCTYIFISNVIIVNLCIAMFTDMFRRTYVDAQEHAAMQRARTILNIENSLTSKSRTDYWNFIRLHCSPLTMDQTNRLTRTSEDIVNMTEFLKKTHQIMQQRFGRSFGEERISTIEEIVNASKEIVANYSRSKEMLLSIFRQLKSLEDMAMSMKVQAIHNRDLETFGTTIYNSKNVGNKTRKQVRKIKKDSNIRSLSVDDGQIALRLIKSMKSKRDFEGSQTVQNLKVLSKSTGRITSEKDKGDVFKTDTVGSKEKNSKESLYNLEELLTGTLNERRCMSKSTGHVSNTNLSRKNIKETLKRLGGGRH